MDFEIVIRKVVGALETAGIHYALIGGFAMAMRGVQRATMDLDFILMLEDMSKADQIIRGFGYCRVFHSPNVSQYRSTDGAWGQIDILHAFRGPTLGMLRRAEALQVMEGLTIRVVHREDIIGLKIQAMVNDPSRAVRDWADILMILEAAKQQGVSIDWTLVEDYLKLFQLEARLGELKAYYGNIEQR